MMIVTGADDNCGAGGGGARVVTGSSKPSG